MQGNRTGLGHPRAGGKRRVRAPSATINADLQPQQPHFGGINQYTVNDP
jgi:hypothetical protein